MLSLLQNTASLLGQLQQPACWQFQQPYVQMLHSITHCFNKSKQGSVAQQHCDLVLQSQPTVPHVERGQASTAARRGYSSTCMCMCKRRCQALSVPLQIWPPLTFPASSMAHTLKA
jgi:hypothetical protein